MLFDVDAFPIDRDGESGDCILSFRTGDLSESLRDVGFDLKQALEDDDGIARIDIEIKAIPEDDDEF